MNDTSSTSTIEEEPDEITLTDIYDQLLLAGELVLTIPADEEPALRKGLAIAKSRQNTKLRDNGIAPDKLTLKFATTPAKTEDGEERKGVIDVHVSLAPRAGITVFKMIAPDPDI